MWPMNELGRGFGDLSRGFGFANAHPRLWGWVMAPAAVTVVLLGAIIYVVMRIADSLVTRVTSWLPDAIASWGGWVIWAVVLVALIAGGVLVFVSVAGVVAGPFNEMLSEAVEERVTGKPAPAFSFGAFVTAFVRGVGHGVKRIVVAIVGALMLFALNFIPVIGTIAAMLLGWYFSARGAAYDCYDAVLARRDLSYDAKLRYLAERRNRTLGLGAGVAALLVVPIANVVALGIGAIGATLAVLDEKGASGIVTR